MSRQITSQRQKNLEDSFTIAVNICPAILHEMIILTNGKLLNDIELYDVANIAKIPGKIVTLERDVQLTKPASGTPPSQAHIRALEELRQERDKEDYTTILEKKDNTYKIVVTNEFHYEHMYPHTPVTQYVRIDENTLLITCKNGIEQDDEVICFITWLLRKIRGTSQKITIYTQDNYDIDAHNTLSVFHRTRNFFKDYISSTYGDVRFIENINTFEKFAIRTGGSIAFSDDVATDPATLAARAARFALGSVSAPSVSAPSVPLSDEDKKKAARAARFATGSGSLGGAIVIDYKTKYLKYKEKYLSLKQNIQKN
jgi:hypothetical protein